MVIQINGEKKETPESAELLSTLNHFGYLTEQVAIAVNETVISKSKRAGFRLQEGDRVEILIPQQGG